MRVLQRSIARFLLLGLAGCSSPTGVPLPSPNSDVLGCAMGQLGRAGYSISPGSGTSEWLQAYRVTGSGGDEIWFRVVADRRGRAGLELRTRHGSQFGNSMPPDAPPRVAGSSLEAGVVDEDRQTVLDRCDARPVGTVRG